MTKKTVLLLLTILILFGSLVGCTGPTQTPEEQDEQPAEEQVAEESGKKTISILYMQHWAPGAGDVVLEKAQEWGEMNNVEIQFDLIAEKDFEFKIANAVENRSGPDIALMRTTSPILYQDSLADVSDIAEELIARDGEFYPANKAQSYTGDRFVVIPIYSVIPIWFYRIDELANAGVEFPDTYEDFIEFGQAVNRPEDSVYAFGTALSRSRDGILFTQSVLWAYGSQVTDESGKNITFNSPETLAGLNWIIDLHKEYKLAPPGVTGWDDSSNNKAFIAGQLVTTQNGPSIYYQLKSADDPLFLNTGLAKWPEGPYGRPTMMDNYGLGILEYSNNKELAKDLLRYLFQPENLEAFFTAGGGFQNPATAKYTDNEVFTGDPNLQIVTDMLPTALAPGWPGPLSRAVAEIENQGVITDMVARVLVDGITPEQALEEATQRIEEIYANYE